MRAEPHTDLTQPAETRRAPAHLVGCCSSCPVVRTASSQDQPECRAARANSWATRIACSSAFPCPFGRGEALADSGREGRGRPGARAAMCRPLLASPSLLVRARPACLGSTRPKGALAPLKRASEHEPPSRLDARPASRRNLYFSDP